MGSKGLCLKNTRKNKKNPKIKCIIQNNYKNIGVAPYKKNGSGLRNLLLNPIKMRDVAHLNFFVSLVDLEFPTVVILRS